MKTLIKGVVIATMALSAGVAVAGEKGQDAGKKAKVETASTFERTNSFFLRKRPITDAGVERLIRSAREAGN